MRSPSVLLVVTAAFFPAYAFQLPFNFPFFGRSPEAPPPLVVQDATEFVVPNRIAIIGAGAGGSSAALWIAKAKERYGLDLDVDVYDRNDYIGGRSTTVHPYGDDTLGHIELGASIFVKVNKNLWRAVDEFGLERVAFTDEDDDESMGIWDGNEVVLTIGGKSLFYGWWDKIKLLWRYGYTAPTKTRNLVEEMVSRFITLYQPSVPRWSNITSITSEMDWSDIVAQTATEYLDTQGIDKRFSREMIEAATRVNYGQDLDKIHGLEALCSLAATGASGVKGGNFQIFEHFIAASQASVHLNTTVTALKRLFHNGPWQVFTTASDQPQYYRAVILAAPYHQTGIAFLSDTPLAPVPQQPYVHLHVTLLTTSSVAPNASYFNLPHGAKVPTSMLTTHEGVRQRGVPEPEFNSLTYHGPVLTQTGEKRLNAQGLEESVVKIFSKTRVEDEWLNQMFEGKVGWVLRKEWDAYPVLPPTTEFPPVKLGDGLYYVNAFEPLISTMETETIAARNVVELLLQEHFNAAICKPQNGTASETQNDDFVYGWDC